MGARDIVDAIAKPVVWLGSTVTGIDPKTGRADPKSILNKKVGDVFGDGHTTSGLDRAMQGHADEHHPVKKR